MSAPRLDLNLLLVFEAILETRSTTLAAARLGLTQSAVSNALNRLRGSLGDPLFVRTSEGMVPTPRGVDISGPLKESIDRIRLTLGHHPEFDPARSARSFKVYMTDVGQMVLLPRIMQAVQQEAPGVGIETVSATTLRQREEAMGSGDVDLAVGYFEDFKGPFHCQALFREEYVCMVREGNPLVKDELTLEQFASLKHVIYHPAGGGHSVQENVIDDVLAQSGLRRKVALKTTHLLGFTRIIGATDAIATLPRRLAQACGHTAPIRMLTPPLEVPAFEIAQFWHRRFHLDPGNQWLRRLFARHHSIARGMPDLPAEELVAEEAAFA